MKQLGKNLVFGFCIVAAVLVILGMKRKFAGNDSTALLSQPVATNSASTSEKIARNSPRPRVLQAKPVTQHDRAIASPVGTDYSNSNDTISSPADAPSITPLPTADAISQSASPSLDSPQLIPVHAPGRPSSTNDNDRNTAEGTNIVDTPTVPVVARPRPEFILTGDEDSFWSISEQIYGTGGYYRALFRHNETNVLRPDQLRAGIKVKTPPLEVLRKLYPSDCPPR